MIVEIPIVVEHGGYPGHLRMIEISDVCPQCGAQRGVKRWKGVSYDGSRRLNGVDCWENECGHVDYYRNVAQEGKVVPLLKQKRILINTTAI